MPKNVATKCIEYIHSACKFQYTWNEENDKSTISLQLF